MYEILPESPKPIKPISQKFGFGSSDMSFECSLYEQSRLSIRNRMSTPRRLPSIQDSPNDKLRKNTEIMSDSG